MLPLILASDCLGARFAVRQVGNLPPGIGNSRVVTLDDKAYFASQGRDPNTGASVGHELLGFDGQDVFLAADIRPGVSSSLPRYLTTFGNAIYFQANDGVNGYELWRYDGQQATLIRSFGNAGTSGDPQHFVEWDDQLFFTVSPGGGGGAPRSLYKYDGTSFSFISSGVPGFPSENYYVAANDGFYYPSRDSGLGFDTLRYDGSTSHFFSPNSGIRPAAFENDILVAQRNVDNSFQLVELLPSGQRLIDDGFASTRILPLTEFQGAYYFLGSKPNDPTDLWKYDGFNLTPVASFRSSFFSTYTGFLATEDTLFVAIDGEQDGQDIGNEVWAFDGDSVSLVADIYSGPESSFSQGFFQLHGDVHFFATNPDTGRQIYKIITIPEPGAIVLLLSAFLLRPTRRKP